MKKVNPKTLLLLALLVVLGTLPFAKVGSFDFVAYMDRVAIEDWEAKRFRYINDHVQEGMTLENAAWAFSTLQFSPEPLLGDRWRQISWHPLTWLSLLADSTFWKMDPSGFHLTNLGLHLMSTVLCYLVAMRLTRSKFVAFCTAALFCVHPLQSNVVGWVSARPALLGGFFFFLSMLMYLRFGDIQRGQPGRKLYFFLSVVACLCAVLSKTSNLILPFLFALTDWRFHRKGFDKDKVFKVGELLKKQLADKWAYLAMSGAILVIASPFRFMRRQPMSEEFNFGNFFTGVFSHFGSYLEHIVYPVNVLPLYFPFPGAKVGYVHFAIGIICFLGISGTVWAMRRTKPQLIFGWVWFIICLLPVAGIAHVRFSFTIDYELYAALFGLFFCVASVAFRWGASSAAKTWGVFGVFVILIAACGVGSYMKVGGWKDSASQIALIRKHNATSAEFYEQFLVPAQGAVGNLAEVKEHEALLKKASALKNSGDTEGAIAAFLTLREQDPKDPRLAHALGQLYEESDPEKAGKYFTIACDVTDNNDAAYLHDAALFFLNQRNAEKAKEFYQLANGASNKTPEMQKLLEGLEREIMNLLQ
ncbi:MAG: phospholipid carrier-dependent glycosyltransferase [Verrucomicrobiales bacterium]